jgi:MFS family permease
MGTSQDAGALVTRRRSLIAVITAMVVVNLVYGITLPLMSLILDAQGISKTAIGLSIVVQASGGVLLATVMSRLIVRLGAARVMQSATLLASMTLIVLGLFQDIYIWLPLRFLLGASAAMLWSASETVINELADDEWRGRIMGIYGAAGAAGFALGPIILIVTGSTGMLPFAVTSILVALASLPLFWLGKHSTDIKSGERPSLWRIFKFVPHILLLNLTYAATVESVIAFFSLYAIDAGLSEARSLSLLTTFAFGGVVLQIPLGWLADHMDRIKMLLVCLLATIIGFLIIPEVINHIWGGPFFLFTIGGIEGMIYTLSIILLGQTFRGAELAAATVLHTSMWGVGTMLGPAMVGIGMDVLGDYSMPYLIAAIYVIYLPMLILARRRSIK